MYKMYSNNFKTLILLAHLLCQNLIQCSKFIQNPDCKIDSGSEDRETTLDETDFDSPELTSLAHVCAAELRGQPDHPEENSGEFEGDIMGYGPRGLENGQDFSISYNALINKRYYWPRAVVPYTLSSAYSAKHRKIIANAIKEYSEKTCVRFVPQTNEENYVHISDDGRGCRSWVGRIGKGRQDLNLQVPGCIHKGVVIHELMHAIGFHHEQSRTDRDEYVRIIWENIRKKSLGNFKKYGEDRITDLGTPYDYGSVMHYSATAFPKKRGLMTIQTLKKGGHQIGQRQRLSQNDVVKINKLYKCGPQKSSKCRVELNKDITSENLKVFTGRADSDCCCSLCQQTDGCKAYAWNTHADGTCWLKSTAGPIISSHRLGVRIGILEKPPKSKYGCTLHENTDIIGGCCLPAIHFTRQAKCCQICRAVAECKAWTWDSFSFGTCWLKKSGAELVSRPGSIAGVLN